MSRRRIGRSGGWRRIRGHILHGRGDWGFGSVAGRSRNQKKKVNNGGTEAGIRSLI